MWMGKTFLVKGTVKEIAHVASLKLLGEVKQLEGNYVVIGDSRGVEMMFYYPHDLSNISDFLDIESGDNVAIEGLLLPNDDVSVKKLVFVKCSIKQKPREARKTRTVDYESLAKEWKDNPLKFIHQWTAKTFIVRGTIHEFAEDVAFIEDSAKRLNGNFIVFWEGLLGVRTYFYFSDSSSNLFDFKKGDRVDVKGIFYRRTIPSANELLFVQCSIVQPEISISCPLCGESRTVKPNESFNCLNCKTEITTDNDARISNVKVRPEHLLTKLKSLASRGETAQAEALLSTLLSSTTKQRITTSIFDDNTNHDNLSRVTKARDMFAEWLSKRR